MQERQAQYERDPERLLTTAEAAAFLGLHTWSLHRWRCRGDRRLPWYVISNRVRYKLADLLAFVESGKFGKAATPTRPFGSRDPVPAKGSGTNGNGRRPQRAVQSRERT